MDPPFGGRVEPLAHTVNKIIKKFQELKDTEKKLPVFWVFPYFMEPHILNSLPDFVMLDYKVDYDNHPLFTRDEKGRKYGSPVRIFTNVDPKWVIRSYKNYCFIEYSFRLIVLPVKQGYKYCEECEKWVSQENEHCESCGACTSKDGRTYKHCDTCERCVKPTWKHCNACGKCAQVDHKCGEIKSFIQVYITNMFQSCNHYFFFKSAVFLEC